MSEKIKSFLSGAGSVLQLMPSSATVSKPDFMRVSPSQRLGSDWTRVGQHITKALIATTQEDRQHGATQ